MTKEQLEEFFKKLEGSDGCDFKKDGSWKCLGKTDKSFSEKILKEMQIPEVEAKRFLKECQEHGGYCDCEIIFNAEEHFI